MLARPYVDSDEDLLDGSSRLTSLALAWVGLLVERGALCTSAASDHSATQELAFWLLLPVNLMNLAGIATLCDFAAIPEMLREGKSDLAHAQDTVSAP